MPAAKVVVVSLSPLPSHHPPPATLLRLDTNNLVIDDVKAEKVQHLEEAERKEGGFTVSVAALHLSLVFQSPRKGLNAETTATCNSKYSVQRNCH